MACPWREADNRRAQPENFSSSRGKSLDSRRDPNRNRDNSFEDSVQKNAS